MTMRCKISKLEKPGGPQGNFHALFGRSAAIYGHFQVDTVASEWFTQYHHQPVATSANASRSKRVYLN